MVYSQRSNLARHMESRHKLSAEGVPLTSYLLCQHCDFTTREPHKLKAHVSVTDLATTVLPILLVQSPKGFFWLHLYNRLTVFVWLHFLYNRQWVFLWPHLYNRPSVFICIFTNCHIPLLVNYDPLQRKFRRYIRMIKQLILPLSSST